MKSHYEPSHRMSRCLNRHITFIFHFSHKIKHSNSLKFSFITAAFIFIFIFIIFIFFSFFISAFLGISPYITFIPLPFHTKMAGSHESNPNIQKASSSKKSKHSEKSGQPGVSGKSGKKHKKRVRFNEEHSSKRQRIEDDPSVYLDGPLEAVSPAF